LVLGKKDDKDEFEKSVDQLEEELAQDQDNKE